MAYSGSSSMHARMSWWILVFADTAARVRFCRLRVDFKIEPIEMASWLASGLSADSCWANYIIKLI